MTIVVTGGGSGGHITPILAVAAKLKQLHPDISIVYIGQTGDPLADIPANHPAIDKTFAVRAGKFRRYHGEGLKQLLDFKTVALNLRDAIYVLVGLVQSAVLLRRIRPTAIFTRGGFVSVPVALGGKLNGIPYITHDSDAVPSLANRIIARWAAKHAVALPIDVYPYPSSKTIMTGIPINAAYEQVTPELEQQYKQAIGVGNDQRVLLVTGGGNGAHALNQAVLRSALAILETNPDVVIVHFAGRALAQQLAADYDALLPAEVRGRVIVKDFAEDFYRYSGAAAIVIARGGATNLAEFAVQGKACIVIPPKQLIWAVKNTEALAARGAVLALGEPQLTLEPELLGTTVNGLLNDAKQRQTFERELLMLAKPDAAQELAVLLLELADT